MRGGRPGLNHWALDLDFPPQLLLVVASLHAAPRVVRVGKVYAKPHYPSNSLVAGCISAIWMSRIFVCSILAEVHALSPLRSHNFYDDIVSRISGKEGAIEPPLADHGVKIAQALAKARLTHNKKKSRLFTPTLHIVTFRVYRYRHRYRYRYTKREREPMGPEGPACICMHTSNPYTVSTGQGVELQA